MARLIGVFFWHTVSYCGSSMKYKSINFVPALEMMVLITKALSQILNLGTQLARGARRHAFLFSLL